MKTTIELPDVMVRQAKALAAARGKAAGNTEPPWMAGFGALSDLSDENRRILDAIEEEFEQLPAEDLA